MANKANKAPRRPPVPVYCTQPVPERSASEEWWNFSPIRVAKSSSPEIPERPEHPDCSLYRNGRPRKENKELVSDEDTSETKTIPSNTQPERHVSSSITQKTLRSNGNKVSILSPCKIRYCLTFFPTSSAQICLLIWTKKSIGHRKRYGPKLQLHWRESLFL